VRRRAQTFCCDAGSGKVVVIARMLILLGYSNYFSWCNQTVTTGLRSDSNCPTLSLAFGISSVTGIDSTPSRLARML